MAFSVEDKNGQCIYDSVDNISTDATFEIKEICCEIVVNNFGIPELFIDADNAITKIDRETCEIFFKNNLHLGTSSDIDGNRTIIKYYAFNGREAVFSGAANENPLLAVRGT